MFMCDFICIAKPYGRKNMTSTSSQSETTLQMTAVEDDSIEFTINGWKDITFKQKHFMYSYR